VFTIIRLLYDAVLAIALSVVVAILCGSIAGVIIGASSPNLPISAIAFLLTGAVLLFRVWRNSVPPVQTGV
jgi:zinc transporter ZupT